MEYIAHFWGKAHPEGKDPVVVVHPLVYHSLDVAAVAQVFLQKSPVLLSRIAHLLDLTSEEALRWVTLLTAWHDMGKWSLGFQSASPEACKAMGIEVPSVHQKRRHDDVGQEAVQQIVCPALGWSEEDSDLFRPATGHHGYPPGLSTLDPSVDPISRYYPNPVQTAMIQWCRESLSLLWGATHPPQTDPRAYTAVSWLLSGVVVLSDWMGSDQNWFPYHRPTLTVREYFQQVAIPAARKAVNVSKVREYAPYTFTEPQTREMFPHIRDLTPLQQYMESAPLSDRSQLWIVEEATGAGKTEAAVSMAARMISAGLGAGMYIALPTMAISNSMYRRLEGISGHVFMGNPAFMLNHGRARDQKNPDGTETASSTQSWWLGSHRRAALLSAMGVGTIDQALASVLAFKFQPLRLIGLARSILIVDEVHACDPYMHKILCQLLEFHAALGGSAILLTATLTQSMRQELVSAFQAGLHFKTPRRLRPRRVQVAEDSFPLVTCISETGLKETPVASRDICHRQIHLNRIGSVEAAYQVVVQAASSGHCVAWIRNTVDEAIETAAELRGAGLEVRLIHARYAYGHRKQIEDEILQRLGPNGSNDRSGFVVVSTQIIEQSLDIDLDVMVTDLAPLDVLIQRAGRLHRHQRGDRGRATLHVVAPDPDACTSPNWLKEVLPRTQYVYEDVPVLWRTAKVVEKGVINLPDDSRELMDTVFGPEAEYPEPLEALALASEGETLAKRTIASSYSLRIGLGYTSDQGYSKSSEPVTRLGTPTVTLALCVMVGGVPKPLLDTWADSEVTISARHVREIPLPVGLDLETWMNGKDHPRKYTHPVFLIDGAAEVTDNRGRQRCLTYAADVGLRIT